MPTAENESTIASSLLAGAAGQRSVASDPEPDDLPPASDAYVSSKHGAEPIQIGPYQVGPLIGRGGMGEVFAGFDPRLDRAVAIKRVSSAAFPQPNHALDFRNEARHAARLSHPNIVQLYDVVHADGIDYTISELVDGPSLGELVQASASHRLPLERALSIAVDVARALAHAHDHGVVHRDVKAANVIVARNGDVKLGDFGIARSMRGLGPPSAGATGDVLTGTYCAMSPEQSLGQYTDARSDLFSFGALLYELVSGVAPFFSSDPANSLRLVREGQPLPLTEAQPDVPARLSRLVARLLEKRRDDRPESAREVEHELADILVALKSERESARPGEPVERQLAIGCVSWERTLPTDVPLGLEQQVRVLEALEDAVARAGGTLLSGAGTHTLFCIGYPQSQENNCEVAIRLLLALEQRAALAAGTLKCSVDSGAVTIVHRRHVLAAGKAIEQAVELAREAEPGAVVVTLSAQTLTRRFFRFTPLVVAIGTAPAPAYRVAEATSPDDGIEQVSATPLRARQRQLEQLERALHDARQGVVVTRLLVGDAGVGKSRLLHEWRRLAAPATDMMLAGYGTPQEQYSPFAPLIRLWRQWCGLPGTIGAAGERERLRDALEQAGLDASMASPLAYALGVAEPDDVLRGVPPERRRRIVIDLFVRLALGLADKHLVLLSFEDLHFVDRSTLEVLRQLVESARSVRLLLVLTARPEFVRAWPLARRLAEVSVDRLASTDALPLIESLTADAPLPPSVTRKLIELGDGVPLVLEELVRTALRAAQSLDRSGPDREFRYVTSFEDSVARRIDELGAAKDIARAAAAVGRESPLRILRSVVGVGEEEFKSRVRKLELANLAYVRETNGEPCLIFAHTLVQEAVQRGAPAEGRSRLEARIVQVLEQEFVELVDARPERFARLYAVAGAFHRAFELFERAGRRAAADSAFAEASTHFQAALSILPELASEGSLDIERQLRQSLGPCLMATEGWSSSVVGENLNRTRSLNASGELGEVWGAWAHGLVTHDAEAVALALEAANAFSPSPQQRFVVLSTRGVTAFYRGQFATARRYLDQAVAMLPPDDDTLSRSTERLALAGMRGWGCEFVVAAPLHLAWMEVFSARRARAEAIHAQAEALLERLSSDPQCSELRHGLYMRVHLGLTLGDYEYYGFAAFADARGPLQRLFEIASVHFPYYRCVAQLGEARGRAARGDKSAIDELLEVYRRMKALARRPTGHVFFATIIAEACLAAGRLPLARDLTTEAVGVADSEFGRFYAPEAYRVAAETCLASDDLAGARAALRQARSACLALDAPPEFPALQFEQALDGSESLLRRAGV